MRQISLAAFSLFFGCVSQEDTSLGTTSQRSELFPNSRWVEGNGGPIDANGGPIDANGGPIDANARRIDGVRSRSLGVNDMLANELLGKTQDVVDEAADEGWHLAETTDVFREAFPDRHRAEIDSGAVDRCLDLAGARGETWRIAPSRRDVRANGLFIESGYLEVERAGEWVEAPVDETLYLPARAIPVRALLGGAASALDATDERPMVLRVQVMGAIAVRDPTDLAAPTIGRTDGAMYRKQLFAVSFCLPDPADAPAAAWVPIGTVTIGDAFGYDAAPWTEPGTNPDHISNLVPWLRFKSYIGRDPGDTSAKAETYYTGGIVTRGDPTLEPRLVCPRRRDGGMLRLPLDPELTSPETTSFRDETTIVPVSVLNARIALVFANAIDARIGSERAAPVLIGETVNGSPIRVSVWPAAGCELRIPGALTTSEVDTRGDWAPVQDELQLVWRLDSLNGAVRWYDDGDQHRSRNTTACGHDVTRLDAWVAAAPEIDGAILPARAELARQRATECQEVRFGITASGWPKTGVFDAWSGPGGLEDMSGVDYWVTAWSVGTPARCGDGIYDREFEEHVCPGDDPFSSGHQGVDLL